MTVREVVIALKNAEEICLEWNTHCIKLDKNNAIMMDAYGDYKVDFINGFRNPKDGTGEFDSYEIGIAVMPIREVRA